VVQESNAHLGAKVETLEEKLVLLLIFIVELLNTNRKNSF